MIYLNSFKFVDEVREYNFILDEKRTCYDSFYPFKILSKNQFERIDFNTITILYGGNGSGKSTALNIIAEKTNISPFHIKAKIIQEVGAQGSSSVSGTYPGYENYYNFFNYGAHDTGDPIANGLSFAKEKGWNTPYKAILGGAELIRNYLH